MVQAVPANFFHGGVDLTKHVEQAHLIRGIGLADLAHGKTHVDEHPIARDGRSILQEAQVNSAAHADNIHERLRGIQRINLNDFPRYR